MQPSTLLKSPLTSIMMLLATLMMSTAAQAHPGHDHHSHSAMLVHLLFYGSIVVAIAAFAWFGYKFLKQQSSK